MKNRTEITTRVKDTANVTPSPWKEQELPFLKEFGQQADQSYQKVTEPKQEADDLRHELPDVGNPVNLPPNLSLTETLKETFRKNELPYKLIKRNEAVSLYGVGGTYTDKILHYEVCQIYIQKAGDRFGKHFPDAEVFPGNERFGKDKSRAIVKYADAVKYYDELTTSLKTFEKGKINTYV